MFIGEDLPNIHEMMGIVQHWILVNKGVNIRIIIENDENLSNNLLKLEIAFKFARKQLFGF